MPSKLTKPSFLAALGSVVGATVWAAPARAADAGCTLSGEPVMPQSVAVFDAPSGGSEIAHFTGAKVPLAVTAFAENGRAAVETSGFRIKGFVRSRDLPLFTAHSVPVYTGHLWIGEARRVTVIGSSAGRLHVEKSVSWPLVGVFQAWAPCAELTFDTRPPPGFTPAGGARGYVVKRDRLDLYSEPKGDVVTTIERASDGPSVLLWSDDRQGGWVHVEHHGEVIIEAWARAQDLSPLPPGETMDQLAPSQTLTGSPSIKLQGTAKAARPAAPVQLRAVASEAGAPIGTIDAGFEVLVLDVVAGWASVVPARLTIAPSGSGQFWARAKDLGI